MNGESGKAHSFCHELRIHPLGLLGKKEYTRQVEIAVAGRQIEILQQTQLLSVRIRELAAIALFQKVPEQQLVQLVKRRLAGQFIGMELARVLEKPTQFLL